MRIPLNSSILFAKMLFPSHREVLDRFCILHLSKFVDMIEPFSKIKVKESTNSQLDEPKRVIADEKKMFLQVFLQHLLYFQLN